MSQTVNMYVCTGTDNITMENLNIYYIKVLDQALQGTAPILDLCQVLLAFSLNSLLVVWRCQIQLSITAL